jgi:hypothetical protein
MDQHAPDHSLGETDDRVAAALERQSAHCNPETGGSVEGGLHERRGSSHVIRTRVDVDPSRITRGGKTVGAMPKDDTGALAVPLEEIACCRRCRPIGRRTDGAHRRVPISS